MYIKGIVRQVGYLLELLAVFVKNSNVSYKGDNPFFLVYVPSDPAAE